MLSKTWNLSTTRLRYLEGLLWKVTRGFGTSCFYIIRYSLVLDQSILYPIATHGPLRFNNGVFSETQTNNSSNPITQASGSPGQGLSVLEVISGTLCSVNYTFFETQLTFLCVPFLWHSLYSLSHLISKLKSPGLMLSSFCISNPIPPTPQLYFVTVLLLIAGS